MIYILARRRRLIFSQGTVSHPSLSRMKLKKSILPQKESLNFWVIDDNATSTNFFTKIRRRMILRRWDIVTAEDEDKNLARRPNYRQSEGERRGEPRVPAEGRLTTFD